MKNTEESAFVEPGTPVYVVRSCTCRSDYAENCKTRLGVFHGNQQVSFVIHISHNEKTSMPYANRSRCIKVFIRSFDPDKHLPLWGKTIFATLDEIKELYNECEIVEFGKDRQSMKETKQQRFKRLAEGRTNKAIKAIQLIGNLSTPVNYSYEDEDVKQIVDALRKTVDAVEAKLYSRKAKNRPRFCLDADESFVEGTKVHLSGDSDAMGIVGYHVRVDSDAVVLQTPKIGAELVLVCIDSIDGEGNVAAYVKKSAVRVSETGEGEGEQE